MMKWYDLIAELSIFQLLEKKKEKSLDNIQYWKILQNPHITNEVIQKTFNRLNETKNILLC